MKTLKSKHNEMSYSISNFNKAKCSDKTKYSDAAKNNKTKIAAYSKCALKNSKSTSQCRKINYADKAATISTNGFHFTIDKACQRNSVIEQSLKKNNTNTSIVMNQPKGDSDDTSGGASKNEHEKSISENAANATHDKENQVFNYTQLSNEIKILASSQKSNEAKCKEVSQLILKKAPNSMDTFIKDIVLLYDERINALTSDNRQITEQLSNIETAFRNKQAELDGEKFKLLKEIKLQQNHIDAQALVISQMRNACQKSEISKNKCTESHCNANQSMSFVEKGEFKKGAVPALDLSKVRKKEGQLSLIVKPSLYHHSLSSDSDEEDSKEQANKTTYEIGGHNKKKGSKVPKLNLYYLKKSS